MLGYRDEKVEFMEGFCLWSGIELEEDREVELDEDLVVAVVFL